jgi:hypothetical protein
MACPSRKRSGRAIRDKHFFAKPTIRLSAYGRLRKKMLPAAIPHAPTQLFIPIYTIFLCKNFFSTHTFLIKIIQKSP